MTARVFGLIVVKMHFGAMLWVEGLVRKIMAADVDVFTETNLAKRGAAESHACDER